MTLTLILYCCSLFLFIIYIALPLLNPAVLHKTLYSINLPLVIFLSIGSLLFMSYRQDLPMLYISQMNKELYPDWSLQLAFLSMAIYYFALLVLLSQSSFLSSIRLPVIHLNSIPNRHLNKYMAAVFSLVVMLCLPHWLSTGVTNSGLYSIFSSPVSYLSSREASLKLSESMGTLALYSYGVRVATFLYPLILWRLCSAKSSLSRICYAFIFLVTMLFSNIQGARAGFFQPLIIAIIAAFLCDLQSIRTNLVDSLLVLLHQSRLRVSLLRSLVGAFGLMLAVIVLVSALSILITSSEYDNWLVQRMFDSVVQRTFSVQFYTGPINIFLVDMLNVSPKSYFGGFPGASFIFETNQSVFALTGEYSEFYFNNIVGDTNNLNTSGLFLNAAFWGPLGPLIFLFNVIVNIIIFNKLSSSALRHSPVSVKYDPSLQLVSFNASIVISVLAWEMPSSVITVFPVMWILAILLAITYRFVSRATLM